MKAGKENSVEDVESLLQGALGKKCWHVCFGAPTLPEFSLALGEKVKRKKLLKNPAQPKAFRLNEGEVSIFVRCVWRLEEGSIVITSSDDTPRTIRRGLNRVMCRKLVGFKVGKPAWELSLEFENALCLKIFSVRTERKPSYHKNWHARIGTAKIYAGPGTQLEISK